MRLPIRRKIYLYIGLPTGLIFLGAAVWVLSFARKQAQRIAEAEIAEMASAAASRFDEYIGKAARVADTTARFVQFVPNLGDSQIYGMLRGTVQMNQRVYGAAMAFEPGTYKEEGVLFSPYAYRDPDGDRILEMDINAEVYDWYGDEQWQWWHLPKKSGNGEWTEPYFDEGAGNVLMTTYAVPFKRKGEFGGVTTVDINLETLQADIAASLPGIGGFYVLGPQGQIIFSPRTNEIMRKTIFEALAEAGRGDLGDVVRMMIGGGYGETTISDLFGEERMLYAYAPIPSPGWTFIAYQPESVVLAEFRARTKWVAASFLSAAALMLGAVILVSGKLARPVRSLRERVLRIAEGEAGVGVDDIRTGDEIEELAGAFGTMQRKVADRERQLENSRETTLTELLESAPDAMIVADAEGRICRMNARMAEIFGYERAELQGMSVESLMPEEFRSGHGKHMTAYFESPKARDMGTGLELLGVRKDGSEFPIEIGLSPFHESTGVMAVAAIRDITERKKAENELRKLNQAVEQGSAVVFITDPEGDIEYVNARFTEVTGYSAEEAIGQNPRLLKSGLQDPAVYAGVWESLTTGEEWRGEFCNRRKDGSIFWASAALAPIRDNEGRTTHFVAIEDDITAEKEAAEEIKKKEERFRTLLANLPGTVYRCRHDADWTMQFISERVEELTGYSAPDFIGNEVRTFDSVIHVDDRQLVADEVEKAVRAREPWTISYRVVHRDGDVRWAGERGQAIYREDGEVNYLDGVIIDITAEKELEAEIEVAREQAEAANRAKSDFLSHMSHELRTPLNGILGYSQILQRDAEVTAGQKESLDAIVSCGDHLLALINDVLDLSKIEAGRIDVDKAAVDLHRLIKGVGDVVQQRASGKGIDFELEVSPEVPKGIITDGQKVRQILVNLLGNAVKFTDEGGVTLHVAEKPKGTLRFDIADSGVGMTAAEVGEIFDPFKQVEAGKAAGGTGLGLAITKRLAEVLGGEIDVASEKGKGSTFTVTIPLEEAPGEDLATMDDDAGVAAEQLVLAPGQDVTILVTDDRETNRDILDRMLTAAGFKPIMADDGDTALEKLREHEEIDLVLMDIRMPRMNGIDAVEAIRADDALKHHKVLAVTASVFPEFREKAIESGFDDFLGKPFRIEELMQKLKKHLGLKFEAAPDAGDVEEAGGAGAKAEETVALTPIPAEASEKLRAALKIKNLTAIKAVAEELSADAGTNAAAEEIGKRVRAFDFKGLEELLEELDGA